MDDAGYCQAFRLDENVLDPQIVMRERQRVFVFWRHGLEECLDRFMTNRRDVFDNRRVGLSCFVTP